MTAEADTNTPASTTNVPAATLKAAKDFTRPRRPRFHAQAEPRSCEDAILSPPKNGSQIRTIPEATLSRDTWRSTRAACPPLATAAIDNPLGQPQGALHYAPAHGDLTHTQRSGASAREECGAGHVSRPVRRWVRSVAELALAESGLSLTQYRILQHLQHSNTIQSDLAFQLTVTKQSVTRLVDGLVDKGYIARTVDDDDRRRVIHAITPKGKRALQRSNNIVENFLMAVLQDLDDDAAIQSACNGIRLFGVAAEASRERSDQTALSPALEPADHKPSTPRSGETRWPKRRHR